MSFLRRVLPWLPKLPHITVTRGTIVRLLHAWLFNVFIPALNVSFLKTETSLGIFFIESLVLEQSLTNSMLLISISLVNSSFQNYNNLGLLIGNCSSYDKVGIIGTVSTDLLNVTKWVSGKDTIITQLSCLLANTFLIHSMLQQIVKYVYP